MKTKLKPHIVPLLSIVISIIVGVVFNDYFLGTITLICGFLNSYYAAIGKWQNYIYSIGFNIFYAYICAINGLYGFLIFTLLVYIPIQIYGLINWLKNKNKNDNIIEMKSLNIKSATILCVCCYSKCWPWLFTQSNPKSKSCIYGQHQSNIQHLWTGCPVIEI